MATYLLGPLFAEIAKTLQSRSLDFQGLYTTHFFSEQRMGMFPFRFLKHYPGPKTCCFICLTSDSHPSVFQHQWWSFQLSIAQRSCGNIELPPLEPLRIQTPPETWIGLRVSIPSPGHRIGSGKSRNLRRYKRILREHSIPIGSMYF